MFDITEVPWRVSLNSQWGAVVCDVPSRAKDSYEQNYGGYLVCESISNPRTLRLVAASPQMRDLLRRVMFNQHVPANSILGIEIAKLLKEIETGNEQQSGQQANSNGNPSGVVS